MENLRNQVTKYIVHKQPSLEMASPLVRNPNLHTSAQFNVWRQTMPYSSERHKEQADELNTNEIEWMSDLFDVTLLTDRVSLNQLRSCHLTSKQTQILATLVPDEVININDLEKKGTSSFVGVLLFADVSGFTALCEKYNNTGKGGTYRLTATLNSYIGAMVEVIYSHGGDVLKFSGDAFLAIWKVKRDAFMFLVIHDALACALFIQQTLGSFQTDVKVFLKVKLAISAGNMTFTVIGDERSRHYIICGTPINDVKMAEHVCVSGDVVLSASAWGHCSSTNYEYSYKDLQHVKVTRIIYNPGSSKREVVQQIYPDKITVGLSAKRKGLVNNVLIQESKSNDSEEVIEENTPNVLVRPSVREAAKRKLGQLLRPFMIPPVVQQVDADQPLEFLTEMRQVTTMFVNLIPIKSTQETLVRMVDEAYSSICRLVHTAMGCVNKVSMFDKDVMFLVIFGLRGYKHESESQSGLKCAYNVRKAIGEVLGVSCVSVGVTTGMVYCGVVGHSLRQEYTVIGGPVNKAARIMCAYPGKVCCDQNTFLHCKLPPNNFILQEAKELKGIGNSGPIYEYTEITRSTSVGHKKFGTYPLLGREEPLEMFHELLSKSRKQYSGLVIQGEARIGKSRLLDELVVVAQKQGYTSILIALNSTNAIMPYATIHLIFKQQVLGWNESSTYRDKEERLVSILGSEVKPDELCYLNDILLVKFPHSAPYLSETPEMQKVVTQRIISDLIRLIFKNLVIAVDDAQYIDPQSWELLCACHEHSVLLVMTMYSGRQTMKLVGARKVLSHSKMVKVHLTGLKEKHLAPLACQILNVHAIAPEVETLLKTRSGGNPGWCESFLVSLIQSGGLKIEEIPEAEVNGKSLIIPHPSLLIKKFAHPNKSKTSLYKCDQEDDFKELSYGIEFNRSKRKSGEALSACVVASSYDLTEKISPQNIEALIMTAFDRLSPYEQLLLKCASVLGETFTRSMLASVMHNPSPLQTSQAVKHLFEVGVLGCGTEEKMHKSEQPNSLVQTNHRSIMENHRTIDCFCHIKPDVQFEGLQLPTYAFCRLLHFKIPQFRETTYELLPGNQKKEFHARAVKFLENETHKCSACGGVDFIHLPPGQQSNIIIQKKLPSTISKLKLSSNSVIAPRSTMLQSRSHKILQMKGQDEVTNNEKTDDPELIKTYNRTHRIYKTKMPKIKSGSYIFPVVDFRNCECPLILSGVYQQLIIHCNAAGLKEKQIKFLIEFGAAAISIGNNIKAINLLVEAEELSKVQTEDDTQNLSHSIRRLNLGRIHTLLGQANLDLGELGEAKKHLCKAMQHFGKPFPSWSLISTVQLNWQMCKQWLHQQLPRALNGTVRGKKAQIYIDIAACLSHISNLYMVKNEWPLANLAAVHSLNLVQCSDSKLFEMCAAYSNMMDVLHHYGRLSYCQRLEGAALTIAKKKYTGDEARELLAVGRLYCATFSSRLLRGELISSIKIGFRTLQISSRVYANNVKLFVLPMLIQALFMNHRLHEAVDLLRELAFTAEEDLDQSSTTWYYALCLDLLLDTCFAVEKPSTCCKFGEHLLNENSSSGIVVRDPDSVRRLTISMWVWYIRKHEWIEAKKWEVQASQYKSVRTDDSFSNLISALKYLECMLTITTMNMNTNKPSTVVNICSDISTLSRKLEKVSKVVKVILPRFLHLKAYFNVIRHYKNKAIQLLNEATFVSEQQENFLQLAWIKHNIMEWNGTRSSIDEMFWKEHSSDETCINWHEFNMHNSSKLAYSFPVPDST